MTSLARSVLALALLGCGSPPSTPAAAVSAPADPGPATPTPEIAPAAPIDLPPTPPPTAELPAEPIVVPDTGLPPISTGPAIRLESLPVTTRDVGGRRVQSVTLASPTAQTALDAWFEQNAWCRGRVQLAIDGFVSYSCTYSEPASGSGTARAAMNARITDSGEVETVRAADVFLPGTAVETMVAVWANDRDAPAGEMSFGPTGAVIVPMDEGEDLLHISWRTIAPYVRADGPLGPALAAAGLTLAPPGTSAPPTPQATTALVVSDAGRAIEVAARLSPQARAGTLLLVGSDESALLLAPGTDRTTFDASGARVEARYLYGAFADIVPVRLIHSVEIHESAGPRTPVIGALPEGAAAVAARGPIGARVSELGTGWVLIAGAGGAGGYVQGREVAASEGCGAPVGSRGVITGYAELAPDRFAWTLAPSVDGTRTVVTLFPVAVDCAIGEQARRASVEGTVTELRLARTTADGAEWLLVVVTAGDFEVAARTVAVFGPASDAAPLYSTTVDAPVIRPGERRGPDRAPGWFPITIASGDDRTWLRWNGSTIEALAP